MGSMLAMRTWRTLSATAALLCSTSKAWALEGEWRVHAGGGVAHAAAQTAALGFAGVAYGVADGFDLRGAVLGGFDKTALGIDGGALFKLEVTEWVPYVGLGLGVRRTFEHPDWYAQLLPAFGVDYLVNRSFSIVAEYRPAVAPWQSPLLEHQALVGLEGRWGW